MERDRESNEYGRPRRYENEDTTPTSDRELKGWYSYGLAAEIFAVAGVGKYVFTQQRVHIANKFSRLVSPGHSRATCERARCFKI
jgi:hypothetical protein